MGLCLLSEWTVRDGLRAGRLVEVLSACRGNVAPVFSESLYAVYVGKRPAPKVRVFIDFLVEELARQSE